METLCCHNAYNVHQIVAHVQELMITNARLAKFNLC